MSLASVAPSVWHSGRGYADAHARGPDSSGAALSQVELARAAQKAVALAQQDKSAWTRADVIKYLGRVLPRSGMDPAAAAALLEDLADRALASEFEPVVCLEAPELVAVPPACCAPTGAASISGTAAPGTPPARSWPWRSAWSRKPARAARRS